MPAVGRRHDLVFEDAVGLVFAALEFVAYHREFLGQILAGNLAVHHAIGFESEGKVQVLVRRWQLFVVVRAIPPRAAVEVGAVIFEQLPDVGTSGRALEKHVLKEVRHAGFAVAFESRADEVGDVHQHSGLALVGKQQHPQTVVHAVLGDAKGGRFFAKPSRRLCRACRRRCQKKEDRKARKSTHRFSPFSPAPRIAGPIAAQRSECATI